MCNSTQNSSITVRDACYGCFFRVGVLTPGAALLNQLSQCSNIYLANTSYAGCASQLAVSKLKYKWSVIVCSDLWELHFFSFDYLVNCMDWVTEQIRIFIEI